MATRVKITWHASRSTTWTNLPLAFFCFYLCLYYFTFARCTFSVRFFDISGTISASYLRPLLLTVWWGLRICRLRSCNIFDTNLASRDCSVADRTHEFVTWLWGVGSPYFGYLKMLEVEFTIGMVFHHLIKKHLWRPHPQIAFK